MPARHCYRCRVEIADGKTYCARCFSAYFRRWKRRDRNTYLGYLYQQVVSRSKRRGFDRPMPFRDFVRDCGDRCAVTGVQFVVSSPELCMSPDRVDNHVHYTAANTRWVCWQVNRLRGRESVESFDAWAQRAMQNVELWPEPLRSAIIAEQQNFSA